MENLFIGKPIFSKIQKGHVKVENLYRALGQTESGRHMAVFFIYKRTREALVISARNMTKQTGRSKITKERNQLPEIFSTISEAGNFWDNHDSTDYENMMEDAEFEIDIKRHAYLVPVANNIINGIRKKAKAEGVSTETLVNILLQKEAN